MKITGTQWPYLLKKIEFIFKPQTKRKVTERQNTEGWLFIYILAKLKPLQ